MKKIIFEREFFNIKDSLECGQVFRFCEYKEGYLIFSMDKCAYLYYEEDKTIALCEDLDVDYFKNYFDYDTDYNKIYNYAVNSNYDIVKKASDVGKGIRIFNQDKVETIISFMISQNNNITRIKGIIEKFCFSCGEKKSFLDYKYYSFPDLMKINKEENFYSSIGMGYRSKYIKNIIDLIQKGEDFYMLSGCSNSELKVRLKSYLGIGEKVANCISLFAYKKTDSFPVDTWIEKIYREDFNGTLCDVNKITEYFVKTFGEYSGYIQQYLFHYKRNVLSKNIKNV